MSNFFTTFGITDVIPANDYGYVITPDGNIHLLNYKFSHNYIICSLFRQYLSDFNLNIDDIDSDIAATDNNINKFVECMPTIRISRDKDITYYYYFWLNEDLINKKMITSFQHIIENVYGCDGSEKCDYVLDRKRISDILQLMKKLKGEIL